MSEAMLTRLVGCNFSFEVWEKVIIHFTFQAYAKVKLFKTKLKTVEKGTLQMFEYLLKVKGIINSLAAVGSPVQESDYIEAIFDDLLDEYESVVTTVLSKTNSYTVDEIEALLLAQESRLEKKFQVQILDTVKNDATNPITANMAQFKNGGRNFNGGFQNNRG